MRRLSEKKVEELKRIEDRVIQEIAQALFFISKELFQKESKFKSKQMVSIPSEI